jgi:hypothetical protein
LIGGVLGEEVYSVDDDGFVECCNFYSDDNFLAYPS